MTSTAVVSTKPELELQAPGSLLTARTLDLRANDGIGASYASFPLDTPEAKIKYLQARGGSLPKLSSYIGKTITIVDVVSHIITLADDDGVATDQPRIVLYCQDGTLIACVSMGVLQSLKMLSELFGPPTWIDGLTVEVQQLETRAGNRLYNLMPVIAAGKKK